MKNIYLYHFSNNKGVHLEGPFFSADKRGCHPIEHVHEKPLKSFKDLQDIYGEHLENVSIITMAPELDHGNVIEEAVKKGITVSMGHSSATLAQGEQGYQSGARCITHLFNGMSSFHHRDPGLVGLIANLDKPIFYGIIADNVHTDGCALRIAYRTNPKGLVLVTDASLGCGLKPNTLCKFGTQWVEVRDDRCCLQNTDTLSGSIKPLDACVRNLINATNCNIVEAIECATLHPAQTIGIEKKKGTLNYGSDADFVFFDPETYRVKATYIEGELAWSETVI